MVELKKVGPSYAKVDSTLAEDHPGLSNSGSNIVFPVYTCRFSIEDYFSLNDERINREKCHGFELFSTGNTSSIEFSVSSVSKTKI